MGRNIRKRRSSMATKAVAASAALALGGGGLIWANFYASAHESNSGQNATKAATAAAQVATISCPDVGQKLTNVPNGAKQGVATELANLDKQITEAYARLASTRQAQTNDASFVQNAITGPLKEKRAATIDRIRINIQRSGGQFNSSLSQLAACTTQAANTNAGQAGNGQQNNGGQQQNGGQNNQNNGGQQQNGGQQNGGQQNNGNAGQAQNGQGGNGPVAADFVDITKVQANAQLGVGANGIAANGNSGSRGTFTSNCGTNGNDNHNTDNVIVAPGVTNGAHHLHDYVGNQNNDAFASDQELAGAGTRATSPRTSGRCCVSRTARRTSTRTTTAVARKATSARSCSPPRRRSSSSATRRARSSRCRRPCASSPVTRRPSSTATPTRT
jgi:hypothetical protein